MANDTMRNRQGSPAEDPLAELARLMGQEDEFADLLRQAQAARPAAASAPRPAARPASPAAPTQASPASSAARPPLPPRPAATRPSAPPSATPHPGAAPAAPRAGASTSFSTLAAEVFAETQRRPAAPQPRPSLEETARGLNRGVVPPERPSAPRPPEARAPLPPVGEPRLDPSRERGPIDRSVGDSAADAIARALDQPFIVTDEPARPAARGEAPPAWMARKGGAPAPVARDVADEDAYDYGRSALTDDGYGDEEIVEQNYEFEGEEAPRPNRRRLMFVGAAILVIIAGATVGFMMVSGHRGTVTASGDTPVIHAEQGPNKIVPTQPAPEASSDGQKLIYDRVGGAPTGNEQIVSSEEQPVDVSQAAQPQQPRVIQPAPSPSASSNGAPAAASNEPKRVRTLTVRADGSIVEDAAPTPVPPATSTAAQSSPQPTAAAPAPLSSGTGAPVSTNPTPLAATPSIVPNAPTRTAAATPAAAPAPAGAYVVQIASVRSEAEAQATWKSMQAKYPTVLNGQPMAVRRADLGDRGIYYRAQVGSFANRDDANALCQALRAQGGDCMVQRN